MYVVCQRHWFDAIHHDRNMTYLEYVFMCVQMLNPINTRMPCENVTEEKKAATTDKLLKGQLDSNSNYRLKKKKERKKRPTAC